MLPGRPSESSRRYRRPNSHRPPAVSDDNDSVRARCAEVQGRIDQVVGEGGGPPGLHRLRPTPRARGNR